MGKINPTRVLLGGLLAGVVLNLGELVNGMLTGEQLAAHMAGLGITAPGRGQIAALLVSVFAYGVVMTWLYAAIKPRFGAGVKTALIAGFAMWTISPLLGGVQLVSMGFFPAGPMTVVGTAWSLIQFLAAAIAGAWVYRDPAAP